MSTVETSSELKQKGNEAYQIQEYAKACEFYEKSLNKTSDPAERLPIYLNLAMSKIYLGKYVEARNICDHALHLDPKSIKGLYRRGWAFLEMQEFEQAILDFEAVLAIDPNNKASNDRLNIARKEKARVSSKEKKIFQNMFSRELYPDKKVTSSKFWYWMILVYIALIAILAIWWYRK